MHQQTRRAITEHTEEIPPALILERDPAKNSEPLETHRESLQYTLPLWDREHLARPERRDASAVAHLISEVVPNTLDEERLLQQHRLDSTARRSKRPRDVPQSESLSDIWDTWSY
jgi:hypothetical protein